MEETVPSGLHFSPQDMHNQTGQMLLWLPFSPHLKSSPGAQVCEGCLIRAVFYKFLRVMYSNVMATLAILGKQ